MAVNNSTILEKAWVQGTNDFQMRIPNPTQAGTEATIQALFDPMNSRFYNEFIDTLVNRIGLTLVRQSNWDNPLKAFKGGKLNFGSTVQELIPRWIKAHTYEDDVESLLKMNRPSLEQAFHTVNRQDRYDITINREELRMAFTEEFGLNNLVSAILQVPYNSDSYDEYRAMVQLIGKYEENFGFYKQHLDKKPVDEESGKRFLQLVREYIGRLRFPSTLYNARQVKGVPVFAKPEELVLLYTPEVASSLSVEVLASLFNVDKAQLEVKTIMVDEFPIPDAVALLTTREWYVAHDKEYIVNNFYNPQTLSINYYLHHWEVLSVSPFVPAILFTTGEGTETDVIKQEVYGLNLNASKTIADPGEKVRLFPSLYGSFKGEEGRVEPESACTYEMHYDQTQMNTKTYVDRNNLLHIQPNAKIGDILHITATSTYRNPSQNDETRYTASIDIYIGYYPGTDIFEESPIKDVVLETSANEKITLSMQKTGEQIVQMKDKTYHVPIFEATNNTELYDDVVKAAVINPEIKAEAQGVELTFENDEGHEFTPPIKNDFTQKNPLMFDVFGGRELGESQWAAIVYVNLKIKKTGKPKIKSLLLTKADTKCHAEAFNITDAPLGQMGKMTINKVELMGEQTDLDATITTDISGQDDMLYVAQDDKMQQWEPYVPGSINTEDKQHIGFMVVQVGKDEPTPENWYAYDVEFKIFNEEDEPAKKAKKFGKRK